MLTRFSSLLGEDSLPWAARANRSRMLSKTKPTRGTHFSKCDCRGAPALKEPGEGVTWRAAVQGAHTVHEHVRGLSVRC